MVEGKECQQDGNIGKVEKEILLRNRRLDSYFLVHGNKAFAAVEQRQGKSFW